MKLSLGTYAITHGPGVGDLPTQIATSLLPFCTFLGTMKTTPAPMTVDAFGEYTLVLKWRVNMTKSGLSTNLEIRVFPRTVGNTVNYREILGIIGKYWELPGNSIES